jgi:predicted permease
MFQTTLEAFIILLLIGIVGFLAVARGLLPRNVLAPVSRIALEIALPALIFTNLVTQDIEHSGFPPWQLPLWWLAFTATSIVLALIASCFIPSKSRSEFRAGLIYPNAAFVPLLLLTAQFGQTSPQIAMLFVFNILFAPVYFSTYPMAFGKRNIENIRWSRVFHPVLIVTILAVGLRATGLHDNTPSPVLDAMRILGAAALPLILLVLGGQITANAQEAERNGLGNVLLFILVKNIAFPAVFLALLFIVRPPPLIALFVIIQAAMPPITSLPIVARRAGADHSLTTRLLIGSFLAAIVTVPLALAAFERLFPLP